MKNELIAKVTRSVNKIGWKFKKHSPEILVTVGVIGIVASTVMACKSTTKVNDIVDEAKETIDKIHDAVENHKHTSDGEEYTQEIADKDLSIVYIQTGWKFVKLYGPAVVLGIASVGCIVGSNRILNKRNAALAAAFTAVDNSFKEYRGRVIDRFGKELDRELRFGIKAKDVEVTTTDENGEEKTETQSVNVVDPNLAHDIYSIIWCEGNTGWTKNPELNKVFLIQQQNYANDKLRLNGVLTLNEVYDMLGVQRTGYGQIAGWVYTEDCSAGDNYVDFGIFDPNDAKKCEFVNCQERGVVLDFNCIGNILNYM